MAQHPASRQVYAAPTREQAKTIVVPTAHLIIPEGLPDAIKPKWYATEHAFIHPNGSRLVVEGADDDQGKHLRGPFADRAYLDELGFWRFADYVYRSVLYPMVERRNGRMIGVSTSPDSPQHEFATILIPEAVSEGSYVKVTLDEDTTVTQAKRDRIAAQYSRTRDPEDGRKNTKYMREYDCQLVTETERAVLPEFNLERHVGTTPLAEFFYCYTVADIGMVDLTHVLLLWYDWPSATIVVENELAVNYCVVSQLAPEIYKLEKATFGNVVPRKRISDAQPIVLAEFARQHVLQPQLVPREIRFAAAQNRDPEALINRMRSLLASDRIKINPRCVELIKQCQGGLWNEKRTDFERIKGLGHLDGLMALAYAVDTIDYQTDPEAMMRKWDREQYPTERLPAKPRDAQEKALVGLLPKALRKPDRKPRWTIKH